ncbi:MAG: hypothetical protein HY704_17040 [Gemmatimonadetes bacterium]|nr:hypothetical protein [Gemmatimonadota bacterium]
MKKELPASSRRVSVLLAALVFCALSACRLFLSGPPTTELVENRHPFRANWILLPEPQIGAGVDLGAAFTGQGAVTMGCYLPSVGHVPDSTLTGSSADRYRVAWTEKTAGNLHVEVADVFGVESAATLAARGEIGFDTVVIRRATGFQPVVGGGCLQVFEGLPSAPGITVLIGARALTLELWDSAGLTVNNEVKAHVKDGALDAGAAYARDRAGRIEIGFGSLRWIGAQYAGYELSGIDPFVLRDVPLGSPRRLPWNYEITVSDRQNRYLVVTRSTLGRAAADSQLVAAEATFFFGIPQGAVVGTGEFFRGAVVPNATGSGILRLTADRIRFRECRWGVHAEANAMREWAERRRLGTVQPGYTCGTPE